MSSILSWIIDIYYFLSGFFQFRKKLDDPPKSYLEKAKNDKNPVLVIHGYLSTWDIMKKITDEISNLGYPVYVFPQLGNNSKSFSESVKIVEEVIEKNNLKNVIIVGYSKGGLIGKSLLIHYKNTEKINGLISIATPFYGSKLANYLKFIKSNDFYPRSKIIEGLKSHPEVNNKIITISSSYDNAIWHDKKASLDGARENIFVNTYGHIGIVFDKEIREKIISRIGKFTI